MMRRALLVITLGLLGWIGTAMTAPAQEPQWRSVHLSASTPAVPIRMVGPEEPWERVVQDIQGRVSPSIAGRAMRVGFYGHGAFAKPSEVLNALPFVAALGEVAAMDVMVFPHWRFPDVPPWLALSRLLLQAQRSQGLPHSGEAVVELLRHTARQFTAEHRTATAQAAIRLAEGLGAFHRQQITPSLAAFSASAFVVVRLGALLESGQLADGHTPMPVAEAVRQEVYIQNVVTFGYPLPYGRVAPALQQRVRGTFINVVPAHCEQQWQGNFLLGGAVENLPVSWAPAHVDWPHLAPQGPEVAALGALLGGRNPARAMRQHAGSRQRQEREPLGRQVWEPLCAALQRFDPAGVSRVLD